MAHRVDLLGGQRLVEVGKGEEDDLHVLARLVGPGEAGLFQLRVEQ